MVERTDWDSLWEIAKRRGIKHPQKCRVLCGECGSELSQGQLGGLVHWEDCEGEWSSVLFMERDAMSGEWREVGVGRLRALADSVLVFLGSGD